MIRDLGQNPGELLCWQGIRGRNDGFHNILANERKYHLGDLMEREGLENRTMNSEPAIICESQANVIPDWITRMEERREEVRQERVQLGKKGVCVYIYTGGKQIYV